MRCSCLFVSILAVVWPNPVYAGPLPQEDSVFSIAASVDRDRITVGDPILYRIVVQSPGDAAIAWSESDRPPEGFDLLSFEHDGPLPGPGDANIDSLRYVLTLYRTGEYSIPPFSLTCILPDGTELSAVSDTISITVASVIDDEATDIRDLKDPAEIPDELPWYWWVIGGLVLIAAAVAIMLYIRRRRNRDAPIESVAAVERPAEDLALEELDRLARREWLSEGRVNAHYSALSEILRRYLSARYRINAMEYTTSELMTALDALDFGHEETRAVRVLFEECDMVKFAKHTPESGRQALSVQEGREIVEFTRPPEVPDVAAPDEPPDDHAPVSGQADQAAGGSADATRTPEKD